MNAEFEEQLSDLTKQLQKSYRKHQHIQRVDEACLPSHERIVAVVEEIRQLLFPGYFGHKELTEENLQYHIGNLLARTGRELAEQIFNCLAKSPCLNCHKGVRSDPEADRIVGKFLAKLPDIRAALAMDADAFLDGDPAAKNHDEIIYCYPGFYAITIYRIAHELLALDVPLMPRIMSEHAHSITGADIHPGANIGERFFIDHATGVVIGETTKIGNNVKIYQGVTLGAKSFPKDAKGRVIKGTKRHPTIENNVTIYPNATILGGETVIGRGSTIGGNVYILESVAPNSLVIQESPELQVLQKPKGK
ncbi:MAG: serine acetyltransferase [Phycisphaerae bacterium]|nr:serine acetyltransferase [Phycisphaerae bacterium]